MTGKQLHSLKIAGLPSGLRINGVLADNHEE